MTSTSESTQRSRPVKTAAVVTHGRVDVDAAVARVRARSQRPRASRSSTTRARPISSIALGGDGTILRTLAQLLGSDVPVIGVNFGRVGFLASIEPDALERDIARVLAGEYAVVELPTLEVELNGKRHVAVNDVVATSATLGRMIELAWAVGGEDLGTVPCDGMICSTPSGSTAYNLSNGGPVLVRGPRRACRDVHRAALAARATARRPARAHGHRREPDAGRPVRRPRRRPPRRRDRAERRDRDLPLRAAEPARDAAGDDVLRRYRATFSPSGRRP